MAINITNLESELTTEVAALTSSNNSDDLLLAALAYYNIDPASLQFSVATGNDLPDISSGNVPEGTIVFVESLRIPVVATDVGWEGLDSRSIKRLFAWGYNQYGRLGTDNTINYSSPVQEVSSSTNWSSVSAGNVYSAAIKTDGTLWAWGRNNSAQLGTDNTIDYSSPVQEVSNSTTWSSVSAGDVHSAAIKTDGTLWAWGINAFGALGTDDVIYYSSPVQEVSNSTTWSSVSAGDEHSAAIKTDGTLWSWGRGNSAQLGVGDIVCYSSPVQEVSSSTNWSSVSAGDNYSVAIKTDGTLWSWGTNTYGQLGTGNITASSSPRQEVSSSTTWSSVSSGGTHTSAIKTDGTLWGWGNNTLGRLGINNTIWASSPVQEVSSSTNWSSVSSGRYTTAAIKTDGTLWVWGQNNSGVLGTGDVVSYSSPVQEVSSRTDWSIVSVNEHTLATTAVPG